MGYPSVDQLQKALAERVFHDRTDTKKAAGRALGTILELITFYLLKQWGFVHNMTIELAIPEFGNAAITHNVEFAFHPTVQSRQIEVTRSMLPLTAKKLARLAGCDNDAYKISQNCFLTTQDVLRNSCVIARSSTETITANLIDCGPEVMRVNIETLQNKPFAMVECKRVGVEEGAKKGPTTIEKAKQGAYVAKQVSSLQKVRSATGEMYAVFAKVDGSFEISPWKEELKRLVYNAPTRELSGFTLTIGIVSNHGNWFTADDPNKELLVLKQSYDWLIFVNDGALAEFLENTLLSSSPEMEAVKQAFEQSYTSGKSGDNRFTKVKIAIKAHHILSKYFVENIDHIEEKWLSVLSPKGESITSLKQELISLRDRDWRVAVVSPELGTELLDV